jgi:hypothetical protein
MEIGMSELVTRPVLELLSRHRTTVEWRNTCTAAFSEYRGGRVIIGVQTHRLTDKLSKLSKLPKLCGMGGTKVEKDLELKEAC